jgi:beta-glucanase (GH16 family)
MKLIQVFLFFSFFTNAFCQPPSNDYNLVFRDDFNTNLDQWGPPHSCYCNACGDEQQFFMPSNVNISANTLKITAKRETVSCGGQTRNITSGQITSTPYFKYGYFEVSCKIPPQTATFPAFWLADHGSYTSATGEIDIFEFFNGAVLNRCAVDPNPRTDCNRSANCNNTGRGYSSTIHKGDGCAESVFCNIPNTLYQENYICGWNGTVPILCYRTTLSPNIVDEFHRYGCEWTPTTLKFFFDGNLVGQMNTPPDNIIFHRGKNIWLDLAIHRWANGGVVSDLPATFEIDWVKVWQKPNIGLYAKELPNVCVGTVGKIGIAYYPEATYEWSTSSSNLQIWSDPWDFEWGICNKLTNVKATQVGQYTVTVVITFPYSRHIESKTFIINAIDQVPNAPSSYNFYPYSFCDYGVNVNTVANASSYIWRYNNNSVTTQLPSLSGISYGGANVSVKAQNVCGISNNFSFGAFLPTRCRTILRAKEVSQTLSMKIYNESFSKLIYFDAIDFTDSPPQLHLKVVNIIGQIVFTKSLEDKAPFDDIYMPNLLNGTYILSIETPTQTIFVDKLLVNNH